MPKTHKMTMSARKGSKGLRIFECESCSYAFAAEVNAQDVIQYGTKVTINYGDLEAAHTLFQIPDDELTLNISSSINPEMEEDFPF
jgi:hypothetical protein